MRACSLAPWGPRHVPSPQTAPVWGQRHPAFRQPPGLFGLMPQHPMTQLEFEPRTFRLHTHTPTRTRTHAHISGLGPKRRHLRQLVGGGDEPSGRRTHPPPPRRWQRKRRPRAPEGGTRDRRRRRHYGPSQSQVPQGQAAAVGEQATTSVHAALGHRVGRASPLRWRLRRGARLRRCIRCPRPHERCESGEGAGAGAAAARPLRRGRWPGPTRRRASRSPCGSR